MDFFRVPSRPERPPIGSTGRSKPAGISTFWIVVIAAVASLLALPVVAYVGAAVLLTVAHPFQLAPAVQGCPSNAFPIYPGSRPIQTSDITVGGTTGCWSVFDPGGQATASDVYGFYADSSNTQGWKLTTTYSNTGFMAFTNVANPKLQAVVEVGSSNPIPVRRFNISVCLCDPRTMEQ